MQTPLFPVAIAVAGPAERPLIEGMFQFYAYDFSELEPQGTPRFEFNAAGQFDPYPLDDYWRREAWIPLLIRVNGHVAGFALINDHSHFDDGHVERNVAEFFVGRKHRRGGVGAEVLRQIVALYPGHWEAAVAERNLGAKVFWPRAIASAPNASNLVRGDGDGAHWTGPIFSFDAAPIAN